MLKEDISILFSKGSCFWRSGIYTCVDEESPLYSFSKVRKYSKAYKPYRQPQQICISLMRNTFIFVKYF